MCVCVCVCARMRVHEVQICHGSVTDPKAPRGMTRMTAMSSIDVMLP